MISVTYGTKDSIHSIYRSAVIQRTLDEIHEDIVFLSLEPSPSGEGRGIRKDYLKVFWQEEFDEGVAPIDSTKGRYHIPRSKIRQYIAKRFSEIYPDESDPASTVLYQLYSGFVHAAGPFIMEMCEGEDQTFLLNGLNGTHRIAEHAEDFWNQHYRGLLSLRFSAIAFGDHQLDRELVEHMNELEKMSGTTIMAEVRA